MIFAPPPSVRRTFVATRAPSSDNVDRFDAVRDVRRPRPSRVRGQTRDSDGATVKTYRTAYRFVFSTRPKPGESCETTRSVRRPGPVVVVVLSGTSRDHACSRNREDRYDRKSTATFSIVFGGLVTTGYNGLLCLSRAEQRNKHRLVVVRVRESFLTVYRLARV